MSKLYMYISTWYPINISFTQNSYTAKRMCHVTPTLSFISHAFLRLNACVQCIGCLQSIVTRAWHVMGKQPI